MSKQDSDSGVKVEIFKIANRLKKKLGTRNDGAQGEGHIDPALIEEADKLIEELCKECPKSISGFLKQMSTVWASMKDMERTLERDEKSKELFTLSHEIKDISAMCGYKLISDFAESLRDYVGKTELSLDAQRVIIQAHIDAITVAHKNDLTETGSPEASELMQLVKVAIEKYS